MILLKYPKPGILIVGILWSLAFGSSPASGKVIQVPSNLSEIPIHGSSLDFYHDQGHNMDLKQILDLPAESFITVPDKVPYWGITRAGIWSRFVLRNDTGQSIPAVLEYGYPSADLVEFHIPSSQGYEKRVSGDRIDPRSREVAYRLVVFGFEIPPGEHVYYFKVRTEGINQLSLRLYARDHFFEKRTAESSLMSFFFGFLTVMFFYNAFLGLTTRNRLYISYVVFNILSILNYLGLQGHYMTLLPPGFAEFFSNEVMVATVGFLSAAAIWFVNDYLGLKRSARRLWMVTLIPVLNALIAGVITLINISVAVKMNAITATLAPPLVAIAIGYRCWQRYRPAYFLGLSWSLFLLSSFIVLLAMIGLLPHSTLTTWAQFIGGSVEVVLLSLAVGDKVRLRQLKADQEIRELNEGLERKVEEKTRDIRSMMGSIRLGIFSIVGQNLVIDNEYSRQLEEILHEENLQGKPALGLIFRHSDASTDQMAMLQSALCSALGDDVIAFDSNAHCFLREIKVHHPGLGEQILELEWNPIVNKQNMTEKVLVVVKDVTEVRRSEEQNERQKLDVQYMTELVALPADRVERFFKLADALIEENKRLVQGAKSGSLDVVRILFINIHTLKGTSRAFCFKDLSDLTHRAEQVLADIRQGRRAWDTEQLMADLDRIQTLLQTYLSINTQKLNRTAGHPANLMIARSELKARLDLLEKIAHSSHPDEIYEGILQIRNFFVSLLYCDIREFLEEFRKPIEKLAHDLKKENPEFVLHLDEVYLSDEVTDVLRNILMHSIRNSLDHGIEAPDERLSQQKSARGRLEVSARIHKERLILTIKDDGRGLALRKIEHLAVIKGLIPERHDLDVMAIANLVFHSGFTTTTSVTDISGRGVGMDAIRSYLEKIGGSIAIHLMDPNPSFLPDFMPFALELQLTTGFQQINRRPKVLSKVS
ncbi:7TM diverse intracellular signaling domain-containing protein [Oligoflexus tunisiensis]|uniref:7TM diverse intracellular signaling domain-containing protein n=1 Tax=Oligoflexus tunisiensis TaxID=708132 RepID=UPI000AD7E9FE|nr:7TM diverse intracellular signaling domain-containing protein [Oligoflexus tunisiensis]